MSTIINIPENLMDEYKQKARERRLLREKLERENPVIANPAPRYVPKKVQKVQKVQKKSVKTDKRRPRKQTTLDIKQITWLDSIGLPNDPQHRYVDIKIEGHRYRVDGYDPETKTVYEFYKNIWNGHISFPRNEVPNLYDNKLTYGELFEKTVQREIKLMQNGYSVIVMWEYDWDKSREHSGNVVSHMVKVIK
jgi:hypothetical protein